MAGSNDHSEEIFSRTKENTAPESQRMKFMLSFIKQSRLLVRSGAHKPHVRRAMREVIFYVWERPQFRKYALERRFSVKAWKFRNESLNIKRRELRYDHAVPMALVTEKLLDPHTDIERALTRWVHARIILREEDWLLNECGLQRKMPDGWSWGRGSIDARYDVAGIRLRPE